MLMMWLVFAYGAMHVVALSFVAILFCAIHAEMTGNPCDHASARKKWLAEKQWLR